MAARNPNRRFKEGDRIRTIHQGNRQFTVLEHDHDEVYPVIYNDNGNLARIKPDEVTDVEEVKQLKQLKTICHLQQKQIKQLIGLSNRLFKMARVHTETGRPEHVDERKARRTTENTFSVEDQSYLDATDQAIIDQRIKEGYYEQLEEEENT